MSGRAIIIVVTGIIIISSIIFYNIEAASTRITKNFSDYYLRQSSLNLAQSGANMALRQIIKDPSWRAGIALMDAFGGKVQVSVSDSTVAGRAVIKVVSVGIMEYGRELERRDTTVVFGPKSFGPATVKALISTNNDVDVNGNLTIDARNHDVNGNLLVGALAGSGIPAVWTTKNFSQGGSADLGGTEAGVDYAPAKPGAAQVIKMNQPYPGGFPGSPDSVLGGMANGFPEGMLKAIAQSGAGGSQYVTNPSSLKYPLKGVTYVDLPSGGTWGPANTDGGGVLIVHNSAKNAIIKNMNSGKFTGLLIADDIVHVHNDIVGAIVSLSPSPSSGNVIGNGNGTLKYSSAVILSVTQTVYDSYINNQSSSGAFDWWE